MSASSCFSVSATCTSVTTCKHHPLIPDGQIVQKFPGFIPQLLQLIGNIGGEIVFCCSAAAASG